MVVFTILLVGVLRFFVNLLLVFGTNRLLGSQTSVGRSVAGAALSGVHATMCLLQGLSFLGGFVWSSIFLLLSGIIAFGMNRPWATRCGIYFLLNMSLSWITAGTGGGLWMPLFGAFAIYFLCSVAFHEKQNNRTLLPVELHFSGRSIQIWALRDTGNQLRDPVTGQSVLIVGPKAAGKLTGLTQSQLEHPVETMGTIPGLRLIPYQTVGQSNGLLLGLKLPNSKIGSWRGSSLVAFAPQGLGENQAYQALTGGYL